MLLLKDEVQQSLPVVYCGMANGHKYNVDFCVYLGCGLCLIWVPIWEIEIWALPIKIMVSASQGRHVMLVCCLFTLQGAFHFPFTVCFSCLFICFFGFLLRKWHIFSTSTPPNRPSSKTQTLQERSVSPTASFLIFAIGLHTALNFYYLLTGPSDVCLCTTARKWKESPSLCWC